MSIDQEIDKLRETLEDIHKLISYTNNGTDDALQTLYQTLSEFEERLISVTGDVSELTHHVADITKQFPHSYVYFSLFIIVMLLLWLLIIYMGFTAHSSYKEVRILIAEMRNGPRRRVYSPVNQFDQYPQEVRVIGDSPPPSYESKISESPTENEETMPMISSDH